MLQSKNEHNYMSKNWNVQKIGLILSNCSSYVKHDEKSTMCVLTNHELEIIYGEFKREIGFDHVISPLLEEDIQLKTFCYTRAKLKPEKFISTTLPKINLF